MSDDITVATEQQNNEWPPVAWKDPFVEPKSYAMKFTNVLSACCTTLDNAGLSQAIDQIMRSEKISREEATKIAEDACDKTPVLLFASSSTKVGDLKKRNPEDWMLTQLPHNPGLAKAIYFHTSLVEAIRSVREVFGGGGLVFHPVPCEKVKNLYTITELYVMPGATINFVEVSFSTKFCLFCKQKTENVCRFCESVPICSPICASMCQNIGIHSQQQCLACVERVVASDIAACRRKLNRLGEELAKKEKDVKDETISSGGAD